MNEQRLVLVRGLPGSGKTTLAEMLDWYEDAIMFSTDDLFMVDGEYKFDAKKDLDQKTRMIFNFLMKELENLLKHN